MKIRNLIEKLNILFKILNFDSKKNVKINLKLKTPDPNMYLTYVHWPHMYLAPMGAPSEHMFGIISGDRFQYFFSLQDT